MVASKHALIGLTKNVAFNYKEKNIRCNAVAPGRVETNLRINSEKLAGSKTARDQSDKACRLWFIRSIQGKKRIGI